MTNLESRRRNRNYLQLKIIKNERITSHQAESRSHSMFVPEEEKPSNFLQYQIGIFLGQEHMEKFIKV
jgi:hypothetical protein